MPARWIAKMSPTIAARQHAQTHQELVALGAERPNAATNFPTTATTSQDEASRSTVA